MQRSCSALAICVFTACSEAEAMAPCGGAKAASLCRAMATTTPGKPRSSARLANGVQLVASTWR